MTRVAIIGATGYAGAELVRILAGHPAVDLSLVTSRQYAGVPFADVFPAMTGRVDIVCQAFDPQAVIAAAGQNFFRRRHPLDHLNAINRRRILIFGKQFRQAPCSTRRPRYIIPTE